MWILGSTNCIKACTSVLTGKNRQKIYYKNHGFNANKTNLKCTEVEEFNCGPGLKHSPSILFRICIHFISCLYPLTVHLGRWGAIAADTVVTMTRCGVVTMGTNDGDPVSSGGNV